MTVIACYVHDATNSTTTAAEEVVTWTVTEVIGMDLDVDEDGPPYLTFMDGWRYRFDHWHIHPWYGEQLTSLVPIASRPRRFEETGRSRRWTSGFK